MLVLARQLNERIVMPTVPATIEVVAVKSNAVRLGIDAPTEITVLREEVLRRGALKPGRLLALSETNAQTRLQGRIKHLLGNRLQTVALGLDLVREQMANSEASELAAMLERMESEVCRLDRQLQALLSGSGSPADNVSAVSPCAVVEAEG